MATYFNTLIAGVIANPTMLFISLGIAIVFLVGGIVLYKNRQRLKGHRWPGITCMLLGCASLVTTTIQYIF